MGYYDLYDGNDNLVASNVWIDERENSGPARPIVINWRKVLIFLMAIVGVANTFVLPLLLFFHKESFVDGGWILVALPSIILGLPLMITAIALLVALKKVNKVADCDDEIMVQAKNYVDTNIVSKWSKDKTENDTNSGSSTLVGILDGTEVYSNDNSTSDENLTDEEYVKQESFMHRRNTAIATTYLVLKFDRLLSKLALISYLVYPIGVLCFVAEALYGERETYLILVGILNYFLLLVCTLSIWKNYKRYKRRYFDKIAKRMLMVALGAIVVGVSVGAILISSLKMSGYCILCLIAMLFDLFALIDSSKTQVSTYHKKQNCISCPLLL